MTSFVHTAVKTLFWSSAENHHLEQLFTPAATTNFSSLIDALSSIRFILSINSLRKFWHIVICMIAVHIWPLEIDKEIFLRVKWRVSSLVRDWESRLCFSWMDPLISVILWAITYINALCSSYVIFLSISVFDVWSVWFCRNTSPTWYIPTKAWESALCHEESHTPNSWFMPLVPIK